MLSRLTVIQKMFANMFHGGCKVAQLIKRFAKQASGPEPDSPHPLHTLGVVTCACVATGKTEPAPALDLTAQLS